MVAAAVVGGAVVGGLATASAASTAAGSQETAARDANNTQLTMFDQTQQNLQPFISTGTNALTSAGTMANNGFNFNPTEANLQNTPGYKFNLAQGEMAAQNSSSARGLGISGQAQVGAEQYATGLADSTYQQQYSNALTNYQTNFGNQLNLANIGENAAAGLGNNATATGQGIASNTIGAGNAAAASAIAGGNAISNATSSVSQYAMFNQLLNSGIYGNDAGGA